MPIWKDFFVHVEPATNSEHQNYLGTSEQSDEISIKKKTTWFNILLSIIFLMIMMY